MEERDDYQIGENGLCNHFPGQLFSRCSIVSGTALRFDLGGG